MHDEGSSIDIFELLPIFIEAEVQTTMDVLLIGNLIKGMKIPTNHDEFIVSFSQKFMDIFPKDCSEQWEEFLEEVESHIFEEKNKSMKAPHFEKVTSPTPETYSESQGYVRGLK